VTGNICRRTMSTDNAVSRGQGHDRRGDSSVFIPVDDNYVIDVECIKPVLATRNGKITAKIYCPERIFVCAELVQGRQNATNRMSSDGSDLIIQDRIEHFLLVNRKTCESAHQCRSPAPG